jgi:hypothetical protein
MLPVKRNFYQADFSLMSGITKTIRLGDRDKPHTVIPRKSRGYLIIHPEAFCLSEENASVVKNCTPGYHPAVILGFSDVVILSESEYKNISQFSDLLLETAISMEPKDAST